jgi:hypothetical protein
MDSFFALLHVVFWSAWVVGIPVCFIASRQHNKKLPAENKVGFWTAAGLAVFWPLCLAFVWAVDWWEAGLTKKGKS